MIRHSGPDEPQDIRISITTKIWGFAVAMLGICIPLVAVVSERAGNGLVAAILPIAVIAGATASTAAVWIFGNTSSIPSPSHDKQLNQQLEQMEERLANLEMISSYERLRALENTTSYEKHEEPALETSALARSVSQ